MYVERKGYIKCWCVRNKRRKKPDRNERTTRTKKKSLSLSFKIEFFFIVFNAHCSFTEKRKTMKLKRMKVEHKWRWENAGGYV